MKSNFTYLIIILTLLFQSCTEPYSPKTESFEDLLIVEGTLTNELKKQEIKLSRTYTFEETHAELVTDASINVSDNSGNNYVFQYSPEDSTYLSVNEFQAQPENEYTLNISTTDGKTYISTPELLPPINQVSVDFEKKKVDGEYGVQISANNYDPTNSSHYYRYEYQETYKVVVPKWSKFRVVLVEVTHDISTSGFIILHELRDDLNTRICYSTKYSNELMLTNTSDQIEDRVVNFPVRFIKPTNSILNYRYSISVKQFVESYEAYTFHKTLKKVAGSDGTVLSPNQPGFVNGNISCVNDPKTKVIGYFEVASVSSDRIFLSHDELFPTIPLPDYFNSCTIDTLASAPPTIGAPNSDHTRIIYNTNTGSWVIYTIIENGLYDIFCMVPSECGDCTTFASNEIPDFWL